MNIFCIIHFLKYILWLNKSRYSLRSFHNNLDIKKKMFLSIFSQNIFPFMGAIVCINPRWIGSLKWSSWENWWFIDSCLNDKLKRKCNTWTDCSIEKKCRTALFNSSVSEVSYIGGHILRQTWKKNCKDVFMACHLCCCGSNLQYKWLFCLCRCFHKT